MRVSLELFATNGHIEGRLSPRDGRRAIAFSGVLELVAALEDLDPEPAPATTSDYDTRI
ncbi:MAG TPA: hypothetical protein VGC11_02410 [Acidimicrobiia bacterium]